MKSPFPGMDPFIEASGLWEDFHGHLVAQITWQLAAALPQGYVARTGTRSYVVLDRAESEEKQSPQPDAIATPTPVAEDEPVDLRAFSARDFEEKFIDISEMKPERRLVTSIEVLSPSNKRRNSVGWDRYKRKRQALLLGRANLVEIDLLRGGERMPMLDPWPAGPYTLLVAREERAPRCLVWPAFFDRPLPAIPVPLSRPDPDLTLDLQPLVDAIYERGRYREDIDYTQPLTPPLTAEQAAWLARQLRGEGASPKPPRPRRRRRKEG